MLEFSLILVTFVPRSLDSPSSTTISGFCFFKYSETMLAVHYGCVEEQSMKADGLE